MLIIRLHRNQMKFPLLLGMGCILSCSGLSMISFSSSVSDVVSVNVELDILLSLVCIKRPIGPISLSTSFRILPTFSEICSSNISSNSSIQSECAPFIVQSIYKSVTIAPSGAESIASSYKCCLKLNSLTIVFWKSILGVIPMGENLPNLVKVSVLSIPLLGLALRNSSICNYEV